MAHGYRDRRERKLAVEILFWETSWLKSQSAWLPRTIEQKVIYDQFLFIYFQGLLLALDIHAIYGGFYSFQFHFLTHHGVQNNIQVKYLHIPNLGILFSHILFVLSAYIQPLGSPGPHWAKEVIKQDAKPSLSDSRDTDLLFLISDGGFYLPDKCQKYHSPSTITLAPRPTFPPLFFPASPPFPLDCKRRSSKRDICNTAAISQTVA